MCLSKTYARGMSSKRAPAHKAPRYCTQPPGVFNRRGIREHSWHHAQDRHEILPASQTRHTSATHSSPKNKTLQGLRDAEESYTAVLAQMKAVPERERAEQGIRI